MLATDWSGDPGFKLNSDNDSSRYFSLSLVYYDEDEIRAILGELRRQQKFPPHFEYHFAKGPSRTARVRHGFMQALRSSSISGFVITVDKKAMPHEAGQLHGNAFVAGELSSLLLRLPDEQVDKATLLVDGQKKDAKPVCDATKRQFKQRAEKLSRECHLGKVKPAESHRTDGIMVADMLAGAAQRAVEGGTPDYLASLRRQITVVRSP